jgi:hypothetical protein
MKRILFFVSAAWMTCAIGGNEADGRGYGGYRGGGGGYSHSSSFSESHSSSASGSRSGFDSFSGSRSSSGSATRSSSAGGWDRSGSAEGSRSGSASAGGGHAQGSGSYDRSYTGSKGGTASASGERGFKAGPNGSAAGSSRDVTATGANGKTYSSSSQKAAAVGPYGRAAGGSESSRTATGAAGTASSSSKSAFAAGGKSSSSGWQSAYAGGGHSSTDFGLAHYSSFGAASVSTSHATAYRSSGEVHAQAGFVRGTFGYYNAFQPAFYTSHPNCWTATKWAAGTAWTAATWASVASYCALPPTPISYNYGNTVVIQDNSVNVNGQTVGTPQEYATQATAIAEQGQKAEPAPEAEWQPLGVFALVQGESTSSNNVFQLALSKDGVIRGNYYDGLMDTTTPVYGSVDKKSQRAAWTIGKKNDRVFEAGIANLTKDDAPVLVHIGKDKTQQWTLVRVQQQKNGE